MVTSYKTWEEEPYFEHFERAAPLLDVRSLVGLVGGYHADSEREPAEWIDSDQPSPEDAKALFHPLRAQEPFYKLAKSLLPANAGYVRAIFEPGVPLAVRGQGQTYVALRSAVASASSNLVANESLTVEHLYALFFSPVEQLGDDDDGISFLERLWIFACYFWALDLAAAKQRRRDEARRAQEIAASIDSMIEGAREWSEELRGLTGVDAVEWVKRHILAYCGGDKLFFILQSDGSYSAMGFTAPQVLNALSNLGYNELLNLRKLDGKWRAPAEVINAHSTAIRKIRYEAGRTKSRILGVDTDSAVLGFGCYGLRTDLEPTFDAAVDEWLQKIGGEKYLILCEWIAHSLAFDRGALQILSLSGEPDCGKKLLAYGLSECLMQPYLATADDLFGKYQDGLLQSPFVWIDEGMPKGFEGKSPADRMREVIGNATVKINRRFMPIAELETNVRVVMTANNHDLVGQLSRGANLDTHTRNAINQRLIHIDIPNGTAAWLAARGGLKFTGAPGRRWIKGDGAHATSTSDFVLAKHFLWLHRCLYATQSTEAPERTTRFLMPPQTNEQVFDGMRMRGPVAAFAVDALSKMLNDLHAVPGKNKGPFERLVVDKGGRDDYSKAEVWVLGQGLIDYAKAPTSDFLDREIPSVHAVGRFLGTIDRPLLSHDMDTTRFLPCADGRITLLSRKHLGTQRWKRIDVDALYRVCKEDQIPCPLLDLIVEGGSISRMPEADTPPPFEAVG